MRCVMNIIFCSLLTVNRFVYSLVQSSHRSDLQIRLDYQKGQKCKIIFKDKKTAPKSEYIYLSRQNKTPCTKKKNSPNKTPNHWSIFLSLYLEPHHLYSPCCAAAASNHRQSSQACRERERERRMLVQGREKVRTISNPHLFFCTSQILRFHPSYSH